MIGIRVDANQSISMGHMMRCIVIAHELRVLNKKCVFIVSDNWPVQVLEDKGFNVCCINTKWYNKNNEIEIMKQIIVNYKISKLIIDSYEVTDSYLRDLNFYTKIIYLDDLYKLDYSVDMIINYGIHANIRLYNNLLNSRTTFLLGKNYTPIRIEFRNKRKEIKSYVRNVFVTTGGSDPMNFIDKLLLSIIKRETFKFVNFHIIIGPFFKNQEKLKFISSRYSQVNLYFNINNMSDIMIKCDIAVSSGGTTLSELCSMGIPTICFSMSDNQKIGVENYSKNNIMISVGDIRDDIDKSIIDIYKGLEILMNNAELRMEMSQKELSYIDGLGARRIANKIIEL